MAPQRSGRDSRQGGGSSRRGHGANGHRGHTYDDNNDNDRSSSIEGNSAYERRIHQDKSSIEYLLGNRRPTLSGSANSPHVQRMNESESSSQGSRRRYGLPQPHELASPPSIPRDPPWSPPPYDQIQHRHRQVFAMMDDAFPGPSSGTHHTQIGSYQAWSDLSSQISTPPMSMSTIAGVSDISGRSHRRLSTEARQGSDDEYSDDRRGSRGELDRSDSSDGETQRSRSRIEQYDRGNEDPWSSANRCYRRH